MTNDLEKLEEYEYPGCRGIVFGLILSFIFWIIALLIGLAIWFIIGGK